MYDGENSVKTIKKNPSYKIFVLYSSSPMLYVFSALEHLSYSDLV